MAADVGSFHKIALTSDREGRPRAGTSALGLRRCRPERRPWSTALGPWSPAVQPDSVRPAWVQARRVRPDYVQPPAASHSRPTRDGRARRAFFKGGLLGELFRPPSSLAWSKLQAVQLENRPPAPSANTQKVCGRSCAQVEGASLRLGVGEVC